MGRIKNPRTESGTVDNEKGPNEPDLAYLIKVWSDLQDTIKRTIIKIVRLELREIYQGNARHSMNFKPKAFGVAKQVKTHAENDHQACPLNETHILLQEIYTRFVRISSRLAVSSSGNTSFTGSHFNDRARR